MTSSRIGASVLPLALLAAVIASLAGVAVGPYFLLHGLDQEIAASEETLVRLRREVAGESKLKQENLDLVALGQEANLLLEGSTAGISGAGLQKLISDIVLEHGGVASSLQLLPIKEEDKLERVALRLSISVDIEGLRNILHAIETGKPLLFIDDLTVRTGEQDDGEIDPYHRGPLQVDLQLSGFRLRDTAGAA